MYHISVESKRCLRDFNINRCGDPVPLIQDACQELEECRTRWAIFNVNLTQTAIKLLAIRLDQVSSFVNFKTLAIFLCVILPVGIVIAVVMSYMEPAEPRLPQAQAGAKPPVNQQAGKGPSQS